MNKKYIIANWKMNGSQALVREWASTSPQLATLSSDLLQLIVCPPSIYLRDMAATVISGKLALGGQDCHMEAKGAFTGDISALMLKEMGAEYVIVGHSERRQAYAETNTMVQQKAETAILQQLTPIICVGETLYDRQAGNALTVVVEQVKNSIPKQSSPIQNHFILAYEPIWAIGSGQTPSIADIEAMHGSIVESLANLGHNAPVVYGGSVNADNAKEILHARHVSGVLVGSASLKLESFTAIARSA
jgi:triosephosphate isomerase